MCPTQFEMFPLILIITNEVGGLIFVSFLKLKEIMPLTQGYIATKKMEFKQRTYQTAMSMLFLSVLQYHIASTSIIIKVNKVSLIFSTK